MGFFGGYDDWAPPGTQDYIGAARNMVNTDYRKPNEMWAQKMLNHLYGGDPTKQGKAYNALQADPMVSSALGAFDSGQRDATRNYQMGTAMLPPGQQALRSAVQGNMDTRAADNKGLLDMNAVNAAIQNYQNMAGGGEARNVQIGQQGMQDWLGGLNQYKRVYKPGILDRIGQVAGVVGQIEGDVTGMGGFSNPFGGGGAGGGSSWSSSTGGGAYGT